ncbi:MAG: heterodisulfide reductase-related iron-sulfur binding cluster [Thermoanaerobaculales bacterium]|nr:heterodisulfide reductase-related iron-sulfur binding cluster [Thermoanaerobaculales bacterium]
MAVALWLGRVTLMVHSTLRAGDGEGGRGAVPGGSGPGAPDAARRRVVELASAILERCRGEGPSNCEARCPLRVDAHLYVQLARAGRFREALQTVRERLPFPGILGYVCTHPCELHCKRLELDRAIRIRDIKRFLAEHEPGEPEHILTTAPRRLQRAAVVGAGPAGLLAAHDLRRRGFEVVLMERSNRIGGCLTTRIPEWQLPAAVRERDLSIIPALGIEVRTGVAVGSDVSLDELASDFDAVLLTVGFAGGQGLLREGSSGLGSTVRGTVWADPSTCSTGIDGVFAGGDAVSGPTSVIDALAFGRRAAEAARRYLEGVPLGSVAESADPPELLWQLGIDEAERRRRERTPVLLAPAAPPMTEREVRGEGERCLDCSCDRCVRECEFLTTHCSSPRDLARRLTAGVDGNLPVVYSCNVCGLCATVCPVDLDTGKLMLAARREAVRRGLAPLPEHRQVRRELRAGVSAAFSLAKAAPGRRRAKRLFFTGCELPATSPGQTRRLYAHLLEQDPRIGVLMHCCGVPAEILGLEDDASRARDGIRAAMAQLEADELLVACPQCQEVLRERFTDIRVSSVWEMLAETWDPDRRFDELRLAVHDPCRSRHDPEVHAAIRTLVRTCGVEVVETEASHERTRCCGAGGKIEAVDSDLYSRVAARAAAETGLTMITYCTGCRSALRDAGRDTVHMLDLLMTDEPFARTLDAEPGIVARLANRLRAKWELRRMPPSAGE